MEDRGLVVAVMIHHHHTIHARRFSSQLLSLGGGHQDSEAVWQLVQLALHCLTACVEDGIGRLKGRRGPVPEVGVGIPETMIQLEHRDTRQRVLGRQGGGRLSVD